MMGSDYYETIEECVNVRGCLPIGLGDGCVVRRAIIDKAVEIGPGVQIGVDHEADRARGFAISASGIVTVGKGQKIMR